MKTFFKKQFAVFALLATLCVGGIIFATPISVHAQVTGTTTPNVTTTTPPQTNSNTTSSPKNVVTQIVGWITVALVWTLGQILVVLMYLLLWVASYNDFINSPAVTAGWGILRDICNMFFVLILLVIAFATILNRENYAMKKLLPKFIIAAILINFSRLICGVVIDFAQVVMLTFVNGFRDIGGGNLANMLGISSYLSMNANSTGDVTTLTIVGTYILALIYSIVATAVVAIILFVLVIRMVMIWIYVVLSPMPYLLSVLPATEKYASKWWEEFSKNVVSGPVQPNSTGASLINGATAPNAGTNEAQKLQQFQNSGAPEAGISQSGSADSMLKFIISIGLLMGGLMITKELGGAVGSVAGSGFDKIRGAAKGVRNLATRPVRERWQAFQGQRDAARKEKIQGFGERMYGRFATTKAAIKTAPRALAQSAALGLKGSLSQPIQQMLNDAGSEVRGARNILTFKNWRQNRQNRNKVKQNRVDAYTAGMYKDATGKYDEVKDVHGMQVYARKAKDAKGNDMKDLNGEQVYEYAKDQNGNHVEKMSEREYKVANTWNKAMYNAKGYRNQKEEKEVNDEQKKMADAGLSAGELLAMLNDTKTSEKQKLAAALTLAIKQGFKEHGQVVTAEKSLGLSNNGLLTKKFSDDVDKKQAYIHYDMDTDSGRKMFERRLTDKKLDVQEAGAYKNANVIKAYDNALTEKEFVRQMQTVSATSKESDDNLKIGHKAYLDKQAPDRNDDGDLVKVRVAVKNITGDLHDVVRGNDGAGLKSDDISGALKAMFDKMSISEIAKLNYKTFDFSANDVTKTDGQQIAYQDSIKSALEGLGEEKVNKIIINANGERKTQRMIEQLKPQLDFTKTGAEAKDSIANSRQRVKSDYSGGRGVGFTPNQKDETNNVTTPATASTKTTDDEDEEDNTQI